MLRKQTETELIINQLMRIAVALEHIGEILCTPTIELRSTPQEQSNHNPLDARGVPVVSPLTVGCCNRTPRDPTPSDESDDENVSYQY